MSLTATTANAEDAVYITDDFNDPAVLDMQPNEFYVIENIPFRGVLVPPLKFQESVGYVKAAKELELHGLDSLPDKPTPEVDSGLKQFFIGLGIGMLSAFIIDRVI